jgi:DtxR family Mn-dependent transcriptional regulator
MTESVEMYLITIARIAAATQEGTVPLPTLAERLDILPVSTNQMIRKLEESGLVRYLPYKGVQLTDEGQTIAAQVLRHHQLWEVFLKNYLNFPEETADNLACRLEHVLSNDEIENLEAFINDPAAPIGSNTPLSISGPLDPDPESCLSDLKINQCGIVTRVSTDQAALSFLSAAGVFPGVLVSALARSDTGDLLAQVGDKDRFHLSAELAAQIWVRKV